MNRLKNKNYPVFFKPFFFTKYCICFVGTLWLTLSVKVSIWSCRRGDVFAGYTSLAVVQRRNNSLIVLVKWMWTQSLFLPAKGGRSELEWEESKDGNVLKMRPGPWLPRGLRRKLAGNRSLLLSPSVTGYFSSLSLTCSSFPSGTIEFCCLIYLPLSLWLSVIAWFFLYSQAMWLRWDWMHSQFQRSNAWYLWSIPVIGISLGMGQPAPNTEVCSVTFPRASRYQAFSFCCCL